MYVLLYFYVVRNPIFVLFLLSREYAKGTNSATPRGTWLRLVKDASGVSDLRQAVLTLEENLRELQEGEDKIEGNRMREFIHMHS